MNLKKIKKILLHNKSIIAILLIGMILTIVGARYISLKKALIFVGALTLFALIVAVIIKLIYRLPKRKRRTVISIIMIGIFLMAILCVVAIFLFAGYIVSHAPEFNPDNLFHKESTIMYTSDGTIIKKLGTEKREKITYEEMPEVLVDAIVATEDSRFFEHNGFDLPRFIKASLGTLAGRNAGGASTLTMQIVKNHFTNTDRSIVRKFTDIYMAIFKVEKNYTKKQIIEFYVNAPYLGSGSWGVEQACQTYFGKSAKDINLPEAALIAGLFNAPDYLDPAVNPEGAEERRLVVLSLMERHGYITSEERKAASAITVDQMLKTYNNSAQSQYQSFIDAVVAEVIEKTGLDPYNTPMEIYTTLNTAKQEYVENLVNGKTFTWENDEVNTGIAVVDSKTGAVVALSGGRNYVTNGTHRATKVKRQIGSTSKPLFDYGPGIEYLNWSTYTPFADEPHGYSSGGYISNWNGTYEGFLTLRTSLEESRNIPALKAFQANDNANIKNFVTSLGLHPDLEGGRLHESHSLGGYTGETPLTMAAAYAAFGNGGYYTEPYTVTKIVYRDSDQAPYETKPVKKKVMSAETAYMVFSVLQDAAHYGLGVWNINNSTFGAKTGTSNFDGRTISEFNLPNGAVNDLWVSGLTNEYAISVWYGYDKISSKHYNTINTSAHRTLFTKVAQGFFRNSGAPQKPANIVEVKVEFETYPGALASEFTPKDLIRTELYRKGTEPTETSKRFAKLENVSHLNVTSQNGKVSITWDAIKTPKALDEAAIRKEINQVFSDKDYQKKEFDKRMAYNKKNIGTLVYNVYRKIGDGELEFLGATAETEWEDTLTENGTVTYVVKSAYTIFKANMSDGAEFKLETNDVPSIITTSLNGEMTITKKVGETYIEPTPSVIVLENTVDVTDKATIETTIVQKSTNKKVKSITTDKPDTYTITYKITYNDFTETLTRTVVVVENSTPPKPET